MSPQVQSGSFQVLVVDDNKDSADTTALLLSCVGYEACAVYDGTTAVELACARRFDAVLLDLGMPIVDGFAVAAELCRLPERPSLIAYSARDDHETRLRTMSVGFDSHVSKPAQLEALVTELQRAGTARTIAHPRPGTDAAGGDPSADASARGRC